MEFFETAKRIGIFIICAQAVLHFKPSAKYEKYLKLLVSIMVLVQLIMPVMNLLSKGGETEFMEKVSDLQKEMEENMGEIKLENSYQEQSVLNKSIEEIKTRFNNIAKPYNLKVYKLEWANPDFSGKITVYIGEDRKLETNLIHIEPIQTKISIPSSKEESEIENKTVTNEELQALSIEFANALSIAAEEIEVKPYE